MSHSDGKSPPSAGTSLVKSGEAYRLLVEAVQDYAIFLLDEKGFVLTWNRGAQRLKGYAASEIIGRHFSQFYPEEDLAWGKPAWELELAAKEGRFEDEGWRVHKNGTRFWANVIITAIRSPSGELIGFGKVTRDFTDRQKAQEALRQANVELANEVAERKSAEMRVVRSERSLRELSLHLLRSQDEERRRIGRDLHDSLGQYLAVLKMNLDSLHERVGPRDEEIELQIKRCLRLAEDSITEIRTISYLLYPPLLEEMGLKSAIPWYLEGFTKRSRIDTTVDIDPNVGRLDREIELALFRILQESLTNVHRHSGSHTASVRLFMTERSLVLEIKDQGKGFSPNVFSKTEQEWVGSLGVGLRGMHERMRQMGGTLEVESAAGGTTIAASVPVPGKLATAATNSESSRETGQKTA